MVRHCNHCVVCVQKVTACDTFYPTLKVSGPKPSYQPGLTRDRPVAPIHHKELGLYASLHAPLARSMQQGRALKGTPP